MSQEIRLSVSKYKTFDGCKKKYNYAYICKLPKKEYEFHIFGTFCHQVLEDFHKIYIEGSKESFNIVMGRCFKKALNDFNSKISSNMKKECWDILNEYLKILYKENSAPGSLPGKVFAVEKDFNLNIGNNVILNGKIDRLQIDDDNVLHVADYKTTKNKKYLKNDWLQLLTYAYVLLMEDPTIQMVRASYILLRHNFEYITAEFSKEEILSIKDFYIKGAADILNEKEFLPTPTKLCSFCDYVDICDAGKKFIASSSSILQNTYGEVSW